MNYINNWLYELSGAFAPGATELPVPEAALDRLQLQEGVEYTLTLAAALSEPDPERTEIVRVVGEAGGGYTIERALEETSEIEWPAGTYISAALTAGMLAALATGGSDTGWRDVPAAAGYTGELPQYRRLNGVVFMRGNTFFVAEDIGAPFAQLPVGSRPSAAYRLDIVSGQQASFGLFVEPNGQMTINGLMDDETGDYLVFDSAIFPAG